VLPDRTIGLYPLRYFTAALNPKRDLVLLTHPAGGTDMLVSRTDGSEPRTVFHYDSTQNTFAGLSWSRDGEWIVFTRGASRTPVAEADIWKMRADGSEQQNLTPQSAGNDSYPSFSGDDKRIVFRSGRSGQFDLYVMNADGTQVRRLTNDTAEEIFPVFSPTANQIAFVSDRDKPGSGLFEVYLLDLNADDAPGRLRRVTHNDVQEGHLAFSYDGKWLIFSSEQGGINDEEPLVQSVVFGPQSYGDMYAYRIADETVIRLTHNKWEEGVPSWEAPLKQ
jgi:Tol biopolymer transport system component